tara:strand:- start:2783 stop:3535 length:753 start_codon:yes stop_codon:yes gene_type:complete
MSDTITLLIDGDIFLYSVTTSCERAVCWDDKGDVWTLSADMSEARPRFDVEIATLKKTLRADKVVIALSDGTSNWRKTVLPSYKAKRKKTRKPLIYPQLKQYAKDTYQCVEWPTLEADDVLGLLAGGALALKGDKIIVSSDKDLKTIPGKLYNHEHPERGVVEISKEEADYNHLFQTLIGDTVDGYKGCPKIGPVSAKRLLEEPTWSTVLNTYISKGLTEEDALVQARVARILRFGEYNMTKKEVRLWEP